MERLLRSVIQVGGLPEQDDSLKNWQTLRDFGIEFETTEDTKIVEYLEQFYNSMSAPPDWVLVKEYFEKKDDTETVSRLEEIKRSQWYVRTNYLAIAKSELERQQTKKFVLSCREASTIAEHGRNLEKAINGKKTLRGVQDAVGYMFDRMSGFTSFETGEKLEGIASDDAEEVLDEYDSVHGSNQFAGRNLFGLEPVDSVCRGHRSGEYWIHCAFAGELKSSLALNYAYNNSFLYEKNIFYAFLEMTYKTLRRQLFVLHSSNGKFVTDWYEQDRRKGIPEENRFRGLDYRKVRDGELTDIERERLVKVAQDYKATSKGKIYIWKPEEQATMHDIKRRAEMFNNKYGCDGIIIDYIGLVKPKYRSNDYLVNINNVISEGRLMALNFARGKTIPILGLFQMNRQGKLRADKANGRYDFAAIAHANQVEKDADVITYTYLNDQLRQEGKFFMGCIKNRDNPIFEQMTGKILWQSKRMRAIDAATLDVDPIQVVQNCNEITNLSMVDML